MLPPLPEIAEPRRGVAGCAGCREPRRLDGCRCLRGSSRAGCMRQGRGVFFLLGGGYVKPHQPLSLRVSNFLGCWGYARARMPRNRPPWLLLLVGSWSRGGVLEVVKIVQIAHPKKRAPARARMPRNPPAWWCYSLAPGRSPRAAASCSPAVGRAEVVPINGPTIKNIVTWVCGTFLRVIFAAPKSYSSRQHRRLK